jgi:apoptosis-inducing factor 3
MALQKLCKAGEVPLGELRQFSLSGADIIVANVKGQFHCLASRCTHAGAPLINGVLKGDELECPWHDASFRITDGVVNYGPPKSPIKKYSCSVKGDYIFVDLPPTSAK